jgi:three-Cys-motif partner protein
MSQESLYVGREQTQVKHFILRKYLERFALIVGHFANSITYVDCFSGPWNVRSQELNDSSFAIAIEELRKARTTLAEKGKALKLRCMFLEENREAFAKLDAFTKQVQDIEIRTRNDELAGSIPEILKFVKQGGRTFSFIFIDPTGWTGFEMNLIAPLLRLRPGEVLINFMTDYIRRFIDHPIEQTQKSFADLFGSGDFKVRIQKLENHQDREDALLEAYAENIKRTGDFTHTCAAIVLYPEIDRSYFHLMYATRNRKGVEVFKNVEKRAMQMMEQTRAEAKQRKRVKKTSQPELFPAAEMPHSTPIDQLRFRNMKKAEQSVLELLKSGNRVPYQITWDLALSFPLVWDSDLKNWIKHWKAEGLIKLEGMKPGQRVPKLDGGNLLVWNEDWRARHVRS